MELQVYDIAGTRTGSVEVPEGLLDVTPRRDVLHAVVVWQLANRRAYTAHTKTRAEVRGGGRKPWRQKGTGRARAGSRRSPLWRGGGTVHGPRAVRRSHRLPKRVRRLGLRMALRDRLDGEALKVVQGLRFETPSTKQGRAVIAALGGKKTLVVLGEERSVPGVPTATERSFRNLANVKVLLAEGLNVYDVLGADMVLIAEEALPKVFARLAGRKEA